MIISFIDIFTLSLNSFKFSILVFYFDGVDSRVWKPVFLPKCFDSLYIAVSFSD